MRHSCPTPLATCGRVMQEEQLLSVSARVACSSLSKVRSLCKNLNTYFCRKIKMQAKKTKIKIFSIISSFLLLMRLFPLAFYFPNSLLALLFKLIELKHKSVNCWRHWTEGLVNIINRIVGKPRLKYSQLNQIFSFWCEFRKYSCWPSYAAVARA